MPSQERLKELFDYREGDLYPRKSTRGRGTTRPIGCWQSRDYRYACVNYKQYPVHRLIWVWHHGSIPPGLLIDHIDHDPRNNRIENLRLVTNSENGRNLAFNPRSASGVIGVTRHRNHPNKWRATISIGTFDTLEQAIEARRKVETFLGFHPNHGRLLQ